MTSVTIRLDGQRREIAAGTPLSELIPAIVPRYCVAVIRPATRESAETSSFRIFTTQGEVTIDPVGSGAEIFTRFAAQEPLRIHWHDRNAAAFGPFASDITPARSPHLYERGEVILGCGGYDPRRSYLVFSKMRHFADLGAATGGGVIGKVVSGRGVLDRWATSDAITRIEQVISWADTSRSFTTCDGDFVLEDGMEIITHIMIRAAGFENDHIDTSTAVSVEHLMLAYDQGDFVVGRSASTHIADVRMSGIDVPAENPLPRREGMVTARVRGSGRGSVFVYTTDLPASPAHTVVGQVMHGIELARLAREGDVIAITMEPERFDLVGLPLPDAAERAESRGIRIVTEDDAGARVVVDQTPDTTLECLAAKTVRITTIPDEKIIDIALDDRHAPASCEIFRKMTGLHLHQVGRLPFFFHFEDVYLFKPAVLKGENLIPENTPEDSVPAGILGITNDSRRGSGLVGVRTTDNSEFGPTSEPFEGTNLIGKVIDMGKLGSIKENDIVFIREIGK